MSEHSGTKAWTTREYIYLAIIALSFLFLLFAYTANWIQLKDNFISYLLLSSFIIALFLPLISEVDIFNVIKLKKEVSDFKEDVNRTINTFQQSVLTSINSVIKINNIYGIIDEDKKNIEARDNLAYQFYKKGIEDEEQQRQEE